MAPLMSAGKSDEAGFAGGGASDAPAFGSGRGGADETRTGAVAATGGGADAGIARRFVEFGTTGGFTDAGIAGGFTLGVGGGFVVGSARGGGGVLDAARSAPVSGNNVSVANQAGCRGFGG